VKTLADVIAFNRAHRERETPWFGQELFERAEPTAGSRARSISTRSPSAAKGRATTASTASSRRTASTR
jgi:hypothetical protein